MRNFLAILWIIGASARLAAADEAPMLYVHGPGTLEGPAPPVSGHEIDSQRVSLSPGLSIDETLRTDSSVNSFRRVSSVYANPTTQGASAHGIGGSGASRSLVLLDGIPMNDPFGGWIYWSRAESFEIEQIKVQPAWGPLHFSTLGLSGPVSIVSRRSPRDGGQLAAAGGNLGTSEGHALAQGSGEWSYLLSGGYFRSDGYVPLRSGDRGPIDRRLDTSHHNAALSTARNIGSTSLAAVLDFYGEDKGGGTELTGSSAHVFSSSVSIDDSRMFNGKGKAAAYFQRTVFSSDFSTQELDRLTETPALHQRIPAESAGALAGWQANLGEYSLMLGGDVRHTEGQTNEDFRFADGAYVMRREAGGRQTAAGAHLSLSSSLSDRLSISGALRGEWWKNGGLFLAEEERASGTVTRSAPLGSDTSAALLPKLGLRYQSAHGVAVHSALYHSTRIATLNELVRPFRVRNDITAANADLEPEKLFGIEAGSVLEKDKLRAAAVLYSELIQDQVVNVTKGRGSGVVEPCGFVSGVCRQRENVDSVNYSGLETFLDYDISPSLRTSFRYFLNISKILDASEAEIEGNQVPHAPRRQASMNLLYRSQRLLFLLEARYLGSQFEDDQNSIRLNDALVFGLSAKLPVYDGLKFFVKADNITNRRYAVARSAEGLDTISPPFILRAGLVSEF